MRRPKHTQGQYPHNTTGTVRVERCLCGHIQLSVGHTSIALDVESAQVISALLAQAVCSTQHDGRTGGQKPTDGLH